MLTPRLETHDEEQPVQHPRRSKSYHGQLFPVLSVDPNNHEGTSCRYAASLPESVSVMTSRIGVAIAVTVFGRLAPTAINHTNPEKRTTGIIGAAHNVTRLREESSPAAAIKMPNQTSQRGSRWKK